MDDGDAGTLSDYVQDIEFLEVLKQFFFKEIQEDTVLNERDEYGSRFSHLPDGRDVRSVYPHGVISEQQLQCPLYFVGFIGYKRGPEEITDDLVQKIWDIDRGLVQQMGKHGDILAYITGDRGDGDWGNLVVIRALNAIEEWRDSAMHLLAIS